MRFPILLFLLVTSFLAAAGDAAAQGFSAHSTSLGISKRDGTPPIIRNPDRSVRLVSEDGAGFNVHFPGCSFEVDESGFDPLVADQIQKAAEADLKQIGWDGDIAFMGRLTTPVRDITQPLLPDFRCADLPTQHVIAVSRWRDDDGIIQRLTVLDYQMDLSGGPITYYFVALRVDVFTLENIEKLGRLAKALRSIFVE